MKIGLDARELVGDKTGKGWYVFHVLKNILEQDQTNEFILYSDYEINFPDFPNAKKLVLPQKGLRWHFAMPPQIKKDKIDLYWAPTSPIVPALTNLPTVFTVHDLTNLLFPQTHTLKGRLIEKIFLGRAIKKSRDIIAVSEATKRDIIKFFPDSKEKIIVTHLGYDRAFKVLPEEEVVQRLEKYDLSPIYILIVATLEPRKNIESLIKAYAKLEPELQKQYPLVIAGKKGWKYERIFETLKKTKTTGEIRLIEYVPFDDLPALYNGAKVFVLPSLYEGFGLPPLEAMACGVPVITSNISSLPEVVGEAGILIDPLDIDSIAENIKRLLIDQNLHQQYSNLSIQRSKEFSWQKTAEETIEIFEN